MKKNQRQWSNLRNNNVKEKVKERKHNSTVEAYTVKKSNCHGWEFFALEAGVLSILWGRNRINQSVLIPKATCIANEITWTYPPASIATISMDVDTAGKQAAAYLTDVAKKRVVVRSK